MRAIVLTVSAAILITFTACELLTGPSDRFIGIIGYEATSEAESGASLSALSPTTVAFGQVATDTTPPSCPDHPHPSGGCPVLEAPDTVDADQMFAIVVRTSGAGGCTQPDGAETSGAEMMREIIPYDRRVGHLCADAPFTLPRTVDLVFRDPGDALIRVTGRILIVGDSVVDERMGSIDHPVVVR